jgi:hypothetical protein
LPTTIVQSGYFTVAGGEAIWGGEQEESAATPHADAAYAGDAGSGQLGPVTGAALTPITDALQVIAMDLVVQGSECVGVDCTSSENFGFDTIRLKENNLRIKFQDTSVGSFPTNDWQLTANDTSNGGASRFSIDDVDAGRTPFTIEAGAPSHSLYVDDGGRVGFGTSTPVVELHVVDGDSPTLRLQQDGSSGFQPQTWDVAGNEANFFVRDVTNGSHLPFKIIPGAPHNVLYLNSDGNVGVNDTSPDEKLTVNGGRLQIQDTSTSSQAGFNLMTGVNTWYVRNNSANGALTISDNAGGSAPFKIFDNIAVDTLVVGTAAGAQEVQVTGTLRVNGMAMTVPDYVFEPDFELESIEDHAAYMWEYKHLPAVGAARYDEQGRASVDVLGSQMGILEELEKAHVYIEQLHGTIEQLQAEARDKDATLDDLAQRLERVEAAIQ